MVAPPLGWQLDPVLIGTIVTLATCYTLAVGPLRARLAPSVAFPRGRALWFYGGLVTLYLLEGSPLHDLAERYLLSAHMLQHLLVSYLVAPMLLLGTPVWVLRPLLLNRVVRPVARVATLPLVAFLVFSILFAAWHIPVIYDGALQNSSLHHFEHVIFLLVSLLVWWPLMSPLPELPRPPYGVQILYLFLLPVAQIPVFGAIAFSDQILYDTYAAAPRVWFEDPRHDQALGGVLMKVGGLFAFGGPLFWLFLRWFQTENRRPARR